MDKTTNKNHIFIIDFLKGIAILSVIVHHIFLPTATKNLLLIPFWGVLAVPIFLTISGFTLSLSNKYNGLNNCKNYINNYYNQKNLINKAKRLFIPYLVMFSIEIAAITITDKMPSLKHIAKLFVLGGGNAPGSYYILVLFQIITVFPFLTLLYNKLKNYSFIIIGIVQLVYEFTIYALKIDNSIAKYTAFRYLFFVLCGIWLYNNYKRKLNYAMLSISMIIGMTWIICTSYFAYTPKIFFATWTDTSLPTAFWYVPIMLILFNKFAGTELKHKSLICKFGRASYHIYLVQMLYFLFVGNRFGNDFINTVVALVACSTVGTLFYLAEQKINAYIKKKRLSK